MNLKNLHQTIIKKQKKIWCAKEEGGNNWD